MTPPPTELFYVVTYHDAGDTWTLHYRSLDSARERARQLRDAGHAVRLQRWRYRVGAVQVVEE